LRKLFDAPRGRSGQPAAARRPAAMQQLDPASAHRALPLRSQNPARPHLARLLRFLDKVPAGWPERSLALLLHPTMRAIVEEPSAQRDVPPVAFATATVIGTPRLE